MLRKVSTDDRASMRPPLFSGGNLLGVSQQTLSKFASMRPPLFSGGNVEPIPGDPVVVELQ